MSLAQCQIQSEKPSSGQAVSPLLCHLLPPSGESLQVMEIPGLGHHRKPSSKQAKAAPWARMGNQMWQARVVLPPKAQQGQPGLVSGLPPQGHSEGWHCPQTHMGRQSGWTLPCATLEHSVVITSLKLQPTWPTSCTNVLLGKSHQRRTKVSSKSPGPQRAWLQQTCRNSSAQCRQRLKNPSASSHPLL